MIIENILVLRNNMTREEAEQIIRECIPQKPIVYYYNDPYDDGKYCGSGWRYEYPPVDPKLIDALIERDKNCKPYIADDEIGVSEDDEKFNAEMEKRFTDLMNRGNKTNSAIEEYRKKNQHLYSMSTKVNGEYLTVIPMQSMTEIEFKEKASSACETLQLNNYRIYQHVSENDKDGHEIFKSFPFRSSCISDADKNACDNVIRFCNKFEKYAKNVDKDLLNKTLNEARHAVTALKLLAEADYLNRIKEYSQKSNL
jgi:hypothetical protein